MGITAAARSVNHTHHPPPSTQQYNMRNLTYIYIKTFIL